MEAGWHSVFRFVLAALAVWRVSFMLAREAGPWDLLLRIRRRLGSAKNSGYLSCVKCISVWVSIPFVWFVGGQGFEKLVVWLALTGVAALIDEWTRPPFELKEESSDEVLRGDTDTSPE